MAANQTSKGKTVAKGAVKDEGFKESAAAVATKQGASVPKTNVPGAEGEAKKEKKLIPDIIRGRMPIAVVAMVRFGDNKNLETKELADLFGTTVGKIADIKKGSTFGYLKDGFKPNALQKEEGVLWLQRHVGFKEGKVDKLISELEGAKEASPEEAASYEAARVAARGQKAVKKDGTPVTNAGGGNRSGAKKAEAKPEKPQAEKPKAKDLL